MPSLWGKPKNLSFNSLIMRLQHLTSVCCVWMANANSCISQLAHVELICFSLRAKRPSLCAALRSPSVSLSVIM